MTKLRAKRLEGVTLPPGVEPENISVNQACVIAGVGRTKLYELMAAGTVESVKIGKRRLPRLKSVRALGSAAA